MAEKIIIGVSGKKQSGKNTLCDCLFNIFSEKYSSGDVLTLSFADALKQKVCKGALGLTEEQVNGTDEQKNSLTIYRWDNLPDDIRSEYKSTGLMTAREIMQVVGTDIFREYFDNDIWVNATLRDIEQSDAKVILISDVRFPCEVTSLLDEGAHVIRLLRDVCEVDAHSSETALDDFDFIRENCIIFDNSCMNIEEQNRQTITLFSSILAGVEVI